MLGFLKKAFERKVYGLDHAVLNVQLPPQSMWMNMGYWKVSAAFQYIIDLLLMSSGYPKLSRGLSSFT
jgi:hypothetical protein